MHRLSYLLFLPLIVSGGILGLGGCGRGGGSDGGRGPTPFNPARGCDLKAYVVAPAGDGSGDIYVGGIFAACNRTRSDSIARFNSDGSVDTRFSVGTGFDGGIESIVPAGDGSEDIYVGGWFGSYNGTRSNNIIKLHSDGSVDAGFTVGTGFDMQVNVIVPAGDGSGDIYVGGRFTGYNGTASNGIIRLNSDGTVDAGFVVGEGFILLPPWIGATIHSITPAGDGSGDIYVGGEFKAYNGTGSNHIIRLHSDGSVNAGFAVGTGFDWTVFSIAPAGGGSWDIYVGGNFTSYNGMVSNYIIRLHSDGSVDAGFAAGSGFDSWVESVVPAGDGSGDIYAGGEFTNYNGTGSNYIVRLNSDGSIDAGFAVGAGFNCIVSSVVLAGDGSGDICVGGDFTTYDETGSNRIIRLHSDGSVDAGFAVGAGFANRVGGVSVKVYSVVPSGNGSGDIYVGGWFGSYNGTGSNNFIRLHSDGSVDAGFDVGSGFSGYIYSIAPVGGGSGDIYVGGEFTTYNGTASNGIIRLHSDGSIETGFDIGTGFAHGGVGYIPAVSSIVPAGDGSGDIYVGGVFTTYNGTASKGIIRLNSDGTMDTGFVTGTGFNYDVKVITPAGNSSGDIYVGGAFSSYNGTGSNRIIRLHSDGSVDAGFDIGTGFDGRVFSIAPAGDGSASRAALVRDALGRAGTGQGVEPTMERILARKYPADIYVGGEFMTYDGTRSKRIIRLRSDGSVDEGFAVGAGFNLRAYSIVQAGDGSGKIYVGGSFTSYNYQVMNGIARLTPGGYSE